MSIDMSMPGVVTRERPSDPRAEEALIGWCLSHGTIPDDYRLDPELFWTGAYQVWAVMLQLVKAGARCDSLSVLNRMEAADREVRVSGRRIDMYLADCVAWLPIDPQTVVESLREARTLRDLMSLGEAMVLAAQTAVDGAADQVEAAERKLSTLGVVDSTRNDTLRTLDEFLGESYPEPEWVLRDYLCRGERMMVTGTPGLGKALALDTPLPTPTGWVTMGAVEQGDQLLGADGRPTTVTATTPVMFDRPCFRVSFSDGSTIVADAEHLWLTESYTARKSAGHAAQRAETTRPRGTDQRHKRVRPAVVSTAEIAATIATRDGHTNHSVVVAAPLELPAAVLPIDPYVLGAWLGDGTSDAALITCHPDDAQILDRIRSTGLTVDERPALYRWSITRRGARDAAKAQAARLVADGASTRAALRRVGIDRRAGASCPIRSFREDLRMLGVLGCKHIPAGYLRASYAQRLALLQGLMDTDGSVSLTRSAAVCEFSVVDKRLALDVYELVTTMGIKATFNTGEARIGGRLIGERYRISFQTEQPVFHLQRKAERLAPLKGRRTQLRYITAVEPVPSVPVRCVQVDASDHLYLAGDAMIPTHNSTLSRQLGVCAAAGMDPFTGKTRPEVTVLAIDLENPEYIAQRRWHELRHAVHSHGRTIEEGRLWLDLRPNGLRLGNAEDRRWLRRMVTMTNPDLLVIGPAYKMMVGVSSSDRDELIARSVTEVIDDVRDISGCAVVLEAHAGKGLEVGGTAKVEPYGSALWQWWTDFGYGIRVPGGKPDPDARRRRLVEFVDWKLPRDPRKWPNALESTGEWMPWTESAL